MEQWIGEKEVVAANEELGKDLEHVEVRGWAGGEGGGECDTGGERGLKVPSVGVMNLIRMARVTV